MEKVKIKAYLKVFLIGLVAQFLMTVLLHFGLQAPKAFDFLRIKNILPSSATLTSPLPSNVDILDQLRPKLEQKQNDFKISKPVSLLPEGTRLVGRAYASADYDQASAYSVVDLNTAEVLLEKNMSHSLPIASLTKIMTAVVALDLASPEETFTVSQKAADVIPTKIGVVAGENMSLKELLNAAMLTSANDAVQVIQEGIDQKYSDTVFVRAMNEKAALLGLKNTHFANPQGFDDSDQYSSAMDLTVLANYALTKYPLIFEIAQKLYQFLPADNNHKQFDLYNWNGLLGVYPNIYGVKIGNTDDAGFTTVVASERDGHKLLVVLLGAPGVLQRDLWAAGLLDEGFAKYSLDPINITEVDLRTKYDTWEYWG